jgi:hypothetical protein
MAEELEELEGSAQGTDVETGSAALSLALGRAGKAGKGFDEDARALLKKQGRLIDLQTEHLHEQREIVLSRLRWGRFSDRMKALLQIMTACIGLAIAGGIGWMAWSASQDRGLVIEPFSVPPDLAAKGMTGQVVASMLLDKLGEMQNATVSSRAPSTYANNWNDQIKVEIPETGVSVGELERLLVQWLGHQTSISGELYRTPTALMLAARTGTAPAKGHAGQEADVEAMVQAAAEDVYATTQPYRYAIWLRRSPDAASNARSVKLLQQLAIGGDRTDRVWANIGLAYSLQYPGDFQGAIQAAGAAIRLEPQFGLAYGNRAAAETGLGHDEAVLADARKAFRLEGAYGRRFMTAQTLAFDLPEERYVAEGLTGDFGEEARDAADYAELQPGDDATETTAEAEAWDHDLAAARATAAQISSPAAMDRSLAAANARADAATVQGVIGAQLDRWAAAKAALEQIDPTPLAPGDRTRLHITETPYVALLDAQLGDIAGARALIATTPTDCYLCVRMRGRIEARAHNWAGAERWFAEAVRQGPSLPFAYVDWARMLLARGGAQDALAKLKLAIATGPHYADAWELQGEALMARRDEAGAARAFAQADANAPKWGKNHLMWGEALMLGGRYAEARAQFEAAAGLEMSAADRAALDALLARTAQGPLHG